MNNEPPEISLAIPIYNESAGLDRLFETIEEVMAGIGVSYEIVCVNDGSSDDTLDRLIAHRARNANITVVDFSRNFGKEVALTAAIDYCRGNTVVPMDADLQDPPALIPELYQQWQAGFEVVHAKRTSRAGESWIKKKTADWFYRGYNVFAEVPIPVNTGDFRLMDRCVVDALKRLPERSRFMKGLFSWVGFKQTSVEFARDPRIAGETKWNYWKLWNFALDGIFSFTTFPLRLWVYLGMMLSMGALVYALWVIFEKLVIGIDAPGYASMS